MHRLPDTAVQRPLQHGDSRREWMVLPLRLPLADPLTCRRALHAILGTRLAGYSLAVDRAHHCVRVDLNLRRDDVVHCMRLLAMQLRSAEFGRVMPLVAPGRPAPQTRAGAAP